MKSLGTALRHAIEQSGYSIYRAANKSGINRTTLQKILSDDRPASAEQLGQLISVLKLSPSEEEEIQTIFEISESGEDLYSIRQLIRGLFTASFDMDACFQNRIPVSPGFENFPSPSPDCQLNSRILSGSQQVISLLRELAFKECLKEDPCLRLCLPGTVPLLPKILAQSMPKGLKVQHITRFLRSPDICQNSTTNLHILSNLLPLSMLSAFDYQIHYFYDGQVTLEALDLAFPYYILAGDMLVLLSPDLNAALACTDGNTVRHFSYLFENALRKTQCLIEHCGSADMVLEYLIKTDGKGGSYNTVEYQPCLITFLEDEHFYQYAQEGIPHRDDLIKAIIRRKHQLALLEERNCIFSMAGLAEFAFNGLISDLPPQYMKPLSVPDRIQALERLHGALEEGTWDFRITNPAAFPLPPHLACVIRGNAGVEFCHFAQDPSSFKHIHIREHTILDAFEDFFQYALKSPLVYTREETLYEIRQVIQELKGQGGK